MIHCCKACCVSFFAPKLNLKLKGILKNSISLSATVKVLLVLRISNSSLATGKISTRWKSSNVTPIFESGSGKEVEN